MIKKAELPGGGSHCTEGADPRVFPAGVGGTVSNFC